MKTLIHTSHSPCKLRELQTCLLCQGEFQATQLIYTNHAVIREDGSIADAGIDAGFGDVLVYCENDHTHDQILRALQKGDF